MRKKKNKNKETRMLYAFGQIADNYIEEAEPEKIEESPKYLDAVLAERGVLAKWRKARKWAAKNPQTVRTWAGRAAAALAVLVLGGTGFWFGTRKVASAAYEPDYRAVYDGTELEEEYLKSIRAFAAETGKELLKKEGLVSSAYSPAALYTSLSMVTELADEDCRAALLSLLQAEDMEGMRENTGKLWKYLCNNPDRKEPGKIMLANSLWLNDRYVFNGEVLQSLANRYYVASYTGDMQKDVPKLASKWVKKQTDGLLDCKFVPDPGGHTMAALLSAIYFYDEWADPFDKKDSLSKAYFYAGNQTLFCSYMKKEQNGEYYRGDGIQASVQYFKNGDKMLFILPDPDGSPEEVLSDSELLEKLFAWETLEKESGRVVWQVPRFQLSDRVDLQKSLTALGLGALFDEAGNPLPLLSGNGAGAYIEQAEQGTAISVNEKGCKAASFVINIPYLMKASAPRGIEMILNRPFLFAILSENDVPLFLGVVRNPNP